MVYLYRKNGGQVLGSSTDNTTYDNVDASYFASVQDPTVVNGADLTNAIWDGTQIRTATTGEQSTFIMALATDTNLQQRAAAIFRLQTDPILRKVLRAIVGQMVIQLNVLRQNPTTTFAAITESQAETAIVNAINAGTFD